MKCQLCGFEFNEKNAKTICAKCPLNKDCQIIYCPNCGYQFPMESRLVNFFRKTVKLFSKKKEKILRNE